MARCKECNFFEEDDDLTFCNHPYFQPSLFGFDIPEEIDCDGFERFYEIAPGRVLTGLMRRINRKTRVINISGTEAIKDLH